MLGGPGIWKVKRDDNQESDDLHRIEIDVIRFLKKGRRVICGMTVATLGHTLSSGIKDVDAAVEDGVAISSGDERR